ncbi:hypothetical protein BYT27DRAFT_7259107 [Phlegmacium glaucopus]|nr:hypothetical protein BYT27DRAFT_7259107 [Phlegmacium glaucopus]
MEDDNEILDWGNEDDEHNETLRRPPFDSDQRDTGEFDAEDSISLGDEDEDNQKYLSYRSEGVNGHSSNPRDITESQYKAPTSQKTLNATGAKQESQHLSSETTHERPSTPHKFSSAEDSPRRKQDSRDRASPQRSQPNPGRLTHALPPKPVTSKVPPYLPPSHPSIVEATSMIISPRAGGRETKKNNGVSSGTSIPSTADELPHNWECREARNGGGKYYYNKETHQSTWEKPVSSIPSASTHTESRSRRRRSLSTGRRHRTPPDSNAHQSQTTRPSRNSAHMPPEREMGDVTKTAPPDPNGLSYEDRHYRPGGEPSSAAAEARATERLSEVVHSQVSSQSRYDRMPPASPPPARRRARSSSHEPRTSYLHEKERDYQSSRGNSHSARGQNAYTNNDPQRDFATLQPDPRWVRTPHPLDFPRSDRDSSRRRGRRQDDDEPMVDEHPDSRNRSSLRRRESSHEPNRDRDPHPSELREDPNQNPVFLSAPSTLSASSHHPPLPSYLHAPAIRASSYSRLVMMSLVRATSYMLFKALIMDAPFTFFSAFSSPSNPLTVMSSLLTKNFIPFPDLTGRGSTPPLSRDRDQYYEPMDREYRAPPEEDPRSTAPSSSRKDRSSRHAGPGPTINIVPAGPEVPFNRPRDRDLPSSTFAHPSRRVGEREYDRNRRDQQIPERNELPKRPVEYPPPTNQVPEQSKRHYDREPARSHPSDFDRSSPDHVGQSSHRKRAPLPPQATTFLTSSTAHTRDAPSHSSSAPVAPRSFADGSVPLGPRSMIHVNEEPQSRSGPTGGSEYDRDRSRNPSRQLDRVSNNYPPPPINIAMDVDDEGPSSTRRPPSPASHRTLKNGPKQYQEDDVESPGGPRWPSNRSTTGGPSRQTASPVPSVLSGPENGRPTGRTSSTLAPPPPGDSYGETRDFERSRREEPSRRKEERIDRYPETRSNSRGRPAEYKRPPAQPVSGTNNIPIGNRKSLPPSLPPLPASSLPLVTGYNPDARPPPSTLIEPAKAKELLPPGKESYERPANLEIADTPQVKPANDASIQNNSRYSESSERQPALLPTGTAPGKSRQRKSRFDKAVAQLEPRSNTREPSPISDKGTRASQSEASDRRAPTPPPSAREPSMVTSMENLSSRLSDLGQQSNARSDSSSMVPVHSHTRPPVTEQGPDQPLLNRFSQDVIPHEPSLPEKPPQHDHAPPPSPPASSRSGHRSGNRWVNDARGNPQNRTLDQPQEYVRLPPTPDLPTSLSHRLSDDKPRHRQHPSGGPVSGRDDKSRGEELSFHNAHAELVREPEDGMTFQDRLEKPQAQRRGASLLDRLSAGNPRPGDSGGQQSLRDRIIPSKRDREDMMTDEGMRDVPFDGEDGTESKRARRKNGRARTRGGRRGGPS